MPSRLNGEFHGSPRSVSIYLHVYAINGYGSLQKLDYPQGIPECGTDALRFALCAYTAQGSGQILINKCIVVLGLLFILLFIVSWLCYCLQDEISTLTSYVSRDTDSFAINFGTLLSLH